MSESKRIATNDQDECVFVSAYDDQTVWLSIHFRRGSASTVLTREQALELIAELQKVVA